MKHISLISLFLFIPFVASAQGNIEFSEIGHSLGTLLWHNPAETTFTLKNTSTKPLTIIDVEPDCGCTTVSWTQTPIAPGKTGTIHVSYDAHQLGHFSKGIAVYTNAEEEPSYLTISGKVVNAISQPDVSYAHTISGINLDTDILEFDEVQRGSEPFRAIEIYNPTRHNITPTLMHLPKYLTATYAPATVYPGQKGKILVTLNSRLVPTMGLSQSTIYLSTKPGERIGKHNAIDVAVTLLPELTTDAASLATAPVIQLDKNSLHLGSLGSKSKIKEHILITNTGKTPLNISAIQVYNPGIEVSISGRTIEPGETRKLKVKVSRNIFRFKGRRRILLITDDPSQPQTTIDIDIEK